MHQTIWAVIVWTLLGACAAAHVGGVGPFGVRDRAATVLEAGPGLRLP